MITQKAYPRLSITKPPLGASIDWSHPISGGMVLCVPYNEGGSNNPVNLVNGYKSQTGSSLHIGWSAGRFGDLGRNTGPNGVTSSNDVFNVPTFNLSAASFEAWITFRDVSGNFSDIFKAISLRFSVCAGTLRLTSGSSTLNSTVPISVGTPYHIVGTLLSGINMSIYINGVLTDSSSQLSISQTNNAVNCLNFSSSNTNQVDGVTDLLRIWNRQLSAAEVSSLYQSPFGMFTGSRNNIATWASASVPANRVATATMTSTKVSFSSSASSSVPVYRGDSTVTASHATIAASSLDSVPNYNGSLLSVSTNATIASSATMPVAVYSTAFLNPAYRTRFSRQKCGLGSQIDWSNPITAGMVLCVPYNEGGGNAPTNLANGTSNISTNVSRMTWGPGVFGCAGRSSGPANTFGGADQFKAYSLDVSNLTSEMWVTPRTFGNSFNDLVSMNNFRFTTVGATLQLTYGSQTVSGPTLSVGQTYHLVAACTSLGTIYIYVNGVLVLQSAAPSITGARTTPTLLNQNTANTNTMFDGITDMARIWNRQLSASEISELYLRPFDMFIRGRNLGSWASVSSSASANRLATASVTSTHVSFSSVASSAVPVYHGSASPSASHFTITTSSSGSSPNYTGSALVSTSHVALASAASGVVPVYDASLVTVVANATFTASSSATIPIYRATASATATHAIFSASSLDGVPNYNGSLSSLASNATMSASSTTALVTYRTALRSQILHRKLPRQKPPLGCQIDWSDSLTNNMAFCIPYNEGGGMFPLNLVNLVPRKDQAGTSTGMSWGPGAFGGPARTSTIPGSGGQDIFLISPYSVSTTTDMTHDCWVTLQSLSGGNQILVRGNFITLSLLDNQTLGWVIESQTLSYDNGSPFPLGVPTHFAVTFSPMNNMVLYMNGLPVASSVPTLVGAHTSVNYFLLGAGASTTTTCTMDLVRGWTRALSPYEVARLYTEPFSMFTGNGNLGSRFGITSSGAAGSSSSATISVSATHFIMSSSAANTVPVYHGFTSTSAAHATIIAAGHRKFTLLGRSSINRGFKDMILIKLNEATATRRRVPFDMVSSSDNISALTGQTFAATDIMVYANGGTESQSVGTVAEIGGGLYYYQLDATEVATIGQLTVRINKTGAVPFKAVCQVVSFDPYDASALGLGGMNINMSQTVPVRDLSALTTQTTGDCLSAARADGAGEWTFVGTTETVKGPDGSTVRSFTLNDATNPTQRT